MQKFEQLEYEFGKWIGNPNCVAVSSGTSALHLALEALCLPYGSRVLIPDFTMVACPRAATMAALQVIFADCNEELLLDTSLFGTGAGEAIGKDIRAIMPVHIYGRQCDMQSVSLFAKANDLYVVEDLAEAHGVNPHPDTDAACWSFYKNKIVHGEEGGMIAFKTASHARTAKELRSLGFTSKHDFTHRQRGVNARMSNLHAAPILESLRNIDGSLCVRSGLKDVYASLIPSQWHMPDTRKVDWVYDVRIRGMQSGAQDLLVQGCRDRKVEIRHAFKPMSKQEEYRVLCGYETVAERMSREVIYLPLSDEMTHHDAENNANVFLGVARELGLG